MEQNTVSLNVNDLPVKDTRLGRIFIVEPLLNWLHVIRYLVPKSNVPSSKRRAQIRKLGESTGIVGSDKFVDQIFRNIDRVTNKIKRHPENIDLLPERILLYNVLYYAVLLGARNSFYSLRHKCKTKSCMDQIKKAHKEREAIERDFLNRPDKTFGGDMGKLIRSREREQELCADLNDNMNVPELRSLARYIGLPIVEQYDKAGLCRIISDTLSSGRIGVYRSYGLVFEMYEAIVLMVADQEAPAYYAFKNDPQCQLSLNFVEFLHPPLDGKESAKGFVACLALGKKYQSCQFVKTKQEGISWLTSTLKNDVWDKLPKPFLMLFADEFNKIEARIQKMDQSRRFLNYGHEDEMGGEISAYILPVHIPKIGEIVSPLPWFINIFNISAQPTHVQHFFYTATRYSAKSFLVFIESDKKLSVFSQPLCFKKEENDIVDFDRKLGEYDNVSKMFIGGNSVAGSAVLHLRNDLYVFISDQIYEFKTVEGDDIVNIYMEDDEDPSVLALGKQFVYFLSGQIFARRSSFPEADPGWDWNDAFYYSYQHEDVVATYDLNFNLIMPSL